MAQVILLGTGAAFSDPRREHTYLAVQGKNESILIDCGGGPVQRLGRAGVALDSIDHLIVTHHHPDHIYGVPVLLLALWLAGRKQVLHIHGLPRTLRAVRSIMHAFEWERWRQSGFFPVEYHPVVTRSISLQIVTPEFSVSTTQGQHLLPTIATRVVSSQSGKSVVYSSDTEVCESIVEIARGADILFHEATTPVKSTAGHSSARQAGAQARRAQAKKLVLVHLPAGGDDGDIRDQARRSFQGPVVVGRDWARFRF
jgi:ribonuclease Z